MGEKSFRFGSSRRVLIASLPDMASVTNTTVGSTLNTQSIFALCAVTAQEAKRLCGVKVSGQVGVTGGGNRGAILVTDNGTTTPFEYVAAGADFVEESLQCGKLIIGGDGGTVAHVVIILKFDG
jgi:hypothetical protein